MRNAQQQCMFESLEKQDLSQLLKSARRPADKLSIVFYSYSPDGVTYFAQPMPYRLKIAIFLPFSHLAPSIGVTRIYGRALRFLKLRVFQAAEGESLVILACTVFD